MYTQMLSIAVANAKGGCGKTTLSTALACRFAQDFKRVVIVDVDPQLGALRWYGHRKNGGTASDNPLVVPGDAAPDEMLEVLEEAGIDVAIFDGAPGSIDLAEEIIDAAAFAVIPLRAGDQDAASTEFAVRICKDHDTPYLLVINETLGATDKRANDLKGALKNGGQPIADTSIRRRVIHADAVNAGLAAGEFPGKGAETAAAEIEALYRELRQAIGGAS